MRKVLTARLVFPLLALTALGAWVACGGSDAQDVITSDAGRDTGDNDRDSGNEEPRDTGAPDTGRDATSQERDAGPRIILDGGAEFEGGIPCFLGGELELEPNDDKAAANGMKTPTSSTPGIRCGAVLVPDGGTENVDWMTFSIGDASTGFRVQYEGQVRIEVETDGQAPVDITQEGAKLTLFRNQPYYAKIRSADGKTQLWKLVLFEDK